MSSPSLQEIVCCMGRPVAANPRQYIIEKAFAAAGLDWRYLTVEVSAEQLPDAMRGMRAMGFRGANLTAPHKAAVTEHLDRLGPAARCSGEANCILRDDDELVGDNTVGMGLLRSLREVAEPADQRVVILGDGPSARAIAAELAGSAVAEIVVGSRSGRDGGEMVDLVSELGGAPAKLLLWEDGFEIPEDVDVVISAADESAEPDRPNVGTVEFGSIRSGMIVADIRAISASTPLLTEAAKRGCVTIDGLHVLANQVAACFSIWTGTEPDLSLMREALEEFLGI